MIKIKALLVSSVIGMSLVFIPHSQAFSATTIVRLDNKNRIIPLQIDDRLSFIAQTKANDMVNKNYFDHTTPDGHRFFYFLQQLGYGYQSAGENLAIDYQNSQQVVDAWMNSPGHKANIINPAFTKTGIGIAYRGNHAYIVQLFAQPLITKGN
jgi:uncharacterized protein YkwD